MIFISRINLILILSTYFLGCAELSVVRDPYSAIGEEPPREKQWRIVSGFEKPNNDIHLGMSMSEVASAWGNPREIHQAGGDEGNQKWIYSIGFGHDYGIADTRVVYFESGRVVGWRTQEL